MPTKSTLQIFSTIGTSHCIQCLDVPLPTPLTHHSGSQPSTGTFLATLSISKGWANSTHPNPAPLQAMTRLTWRASPSVCWVHAHSCSCRVGVLVVWVQHPTGEARGRVGRGGKPLHSLTLHCRVLPGLLAAITPIVQFLKKLVQNYKKHKCERK